jgi:ABC-type dipeptide/oligopeptide/nickel transport system permease component
MTLFLIRRLIQGAAIIFVMSLIVFMGVYAIGNPVEILINPASINLSTSNTAISSSVPCKGISGTLSSMTSPRFS